MTQTAAAMTAEHLSKTYIRRTRGRGILGLTGREAVQVKALQDVSFRMEAGEIVGLIGPNGAGKSTMVKLLTGILTPTGGSCTVDGLIPWKDRRAHVRRLGTVFGQRTQLWWDVPIRDSYALLRDIYALREDRWRRRLGELTDALDLGELLDAPLRQLSLGQRMRAELCGSLLHEPAWLFLDEPTIGLDAVSKLKLRDVLREENRTRGTGILLTTHDMDDMLALCRRVMVLGHGQLLYDGGLQELLQRYDREHTLRCVFSGTPRFGSLPQGVALRQEEGAWLLTFLPGQIPVREVLQLVLAAGELREMTLREMNVDRMIAGMYAEMSL